MLGTVFHLPAASRIPALVKFILGFEDTSFPSVLETFSSCFLFPLCFPVPLKVLLDADWTSFFLLLLRDDTLHCSEVFFYLLVHI